VYKALSVTYIAFQNLAMIVASKFWFKVIRTKYSEGMTVPLYLRMMDGVLRFLWIVLVLCTFSALVLM
jgi:hypothetical protein